MIASHMLSNATVITASGLRDPSEAGAFDEAGNLQILPAEFWRQFTQQEIAVFCHRHALYCIPTTELVRWLNSRIAGRPAIEIGAGTGILSAALGIRGTDNHMQDWPDIKATYHAAGQPTIRYGANVEKLDADVALAKLRPHVVVAAWVTHKWKQSEAWREGNMFGVDEGKIIRQSDYLFIGHEHSHRNKPILERAHETIYPDWLVSRATSPGRDFIKVWCRGAK